MSLELEEGAAATEAEPQAEDPEVRPVINIISDGIGDSAATIAAAAASQFDGGNCVINRLAKAASMPQMRTFIEARLADTTGRMILFYTIADEGLRAELVDYLRDKPVAAVDLIGPAIEAIAQATSSQPKGQSGLIRETDAAYYNRIEAMEYAVEHDDGRNSDRLLDADIVLIGVSRTSKTPLSIYLATLGYKVANVPLTLGSEPPAQLFELDRRRVFGLVTDAQLLASIRQRRLGESHSLAANYTKLDYVLDDLEQARAVMLRIGCIMIRTDNRAVEETAQEVLRHYLASFPE